MKKINISISSFFIGCFLFIISLRIQNDLLTLFGGILIVFGALNFLRVQNKHRKSSPEANSSKVKLIYSDEERPLFVYSNRDIESRNNNKLVLTGGSTIDLATLSISSVNNTTIIVSGKKVSNPQDRTGVSIQNISMK